MDQFGGGDGGSDQPISIATVGPLTGQYASFGQQLEQGAIAAVADINAQGGVLGRQLALESEDDACDPKQAVAVANSLASKGVPIVIGHFCSGSSIPASNVYAEEQMIQISPASTNPQFTERGLDNVFRTCGRDDAQGLIAGAYLAERHGSDRIAIVHDKTAYGKGLADETRAALNAQGVTEALYEAYTAGEKDYSTLVSKLKLEQIDVLYVGGYHSEAGLIVRQMRDQGLATQLISGDALVSQEYWAITGEAGEGTMMTFSPDPRNNPEAADVVTRFREEMNYEPEGYTLYTYAAIQAWVQAAESAGSLEPDAIKAALKGGTFETVLGTLSFDDKGDIEGPSYVFYEWSNGEYQEIN
ncbi:MAG: branched-chain amino acid ABC transporter substrate-binding protein [Rhodospirillaceae bacterium]|nr:branched-chain amino acid ABC transporter substrate-binding protein [Rhodospirillaceae bacterium]